MRWATFDRKMAKVKAAEGTVTAPTWLLIRSLNRGVRR
jgi:hypothetical protein